MRSLGMFAISNILACFWTLTTTLFFTITTAAFGAYPTGDVKARLCEEEENSAESNIDTADLLIPHIVFAAHSLTGSPSFTSTVSPHSFTSRLTLRNRMLSPSDTVASNLWRTYLEHDAFVPLGPKKSEPPVAPSGSPSPRNPLRSDDNGDVSELPYLTKDHTESVPDSPLSSPRGIASTSSSFDSNLLATMLYYGSDSDDETATSASVESVDSEAMVVCPTPKILRSSSRPVLGLQITCDVTDVEPSSPSPVDSGYGSRPDTPFVEKETEPKPLEDVSTCGGSFFSTQNVPTEDDASTADLKLLRHAAPAKNVANQGPTLPQIVLFDEQGRVIDHALGDQHTDSSKSISFDFESESAYGGLMPVSGDVAIYTSTSAANVDVAQHCALASLPTVWAHRFYRPSPAFVLESVEEEEEEVGSLIGLSTSEKEGGEEVMIRAEVLKANAWAEVSAESLARTDCVKSTDEGVRPSTSPIVETQTTGIPIQVSDFTATITTSAPISSLATAGEENPRAVHNEEDDELEACGLFFAAPDTNCLRLSQKLCQSATKPDIAFGLLKELSSQAPAKKLETAYHAAAEGHTLTPLVVECKFDCENGYWMSEGGLASITVPRDCPAHGGRGVCHAGAIFHHSANAFAPDSPSLDYATHAAEVVGMFVPPSTYSHDDFDEDELVLHRAEGMHSPERRSTIPKNGADYDEFISAFMDDVDLGTSSSVDGSKHAPLGKLGDALKELRDAAMPEAVDHFKEGLGKTESVLRAALAASPFKLNVMADKLHFKSGHKSSVSKEKNEFYSTMKERSAISMKGKWSNMLNKFAR
ncbi:hypothetical protein FRC09_003467 [Ceratobasidium sp. 395]|nr:hypothetical protein FRC09_003467 [Ceratobasidium sp. 395]